MPTSSSGLRPAVRRPALDEYAREIWRRRAFMSAYADARATAAVAGTRLGNLWQLITPLLNVAVYYLIFGVILKTDDGVPNYPAFLMIGVFVFTFTQRSVMEGAKSLVSNEGFIRSMHFPRAVLPLSSTFEQVRQVTISMVVVLLLVLVTGEPIRWEWLLMVPALALQLSFNVGAALIAARVAANLPDVNQLLPFILRAWLYASGVFFSISVFTADLPAWLAVPLQLNPPAVYIDLVRAALLDGYQPVAYAWPTAIAWAVLTPAIGFVYFWRAEERYGRG